MSVILCLIGVITFCAGLSGYNHWLVPGAVLIIGGVVWYFATSKKKGEKNEV